MSVSPDSHVDILTLNVVLEGEGTFRRGLGHEGKALMNGTSEDPLPLQPCEDTGRRCQLPHQAPNLPAAAYKPPSLWEVIAARTEDSITM